MGTSTRSEIVEFYLVQKRDGNPTFPYTTITSGNHQTHGNSDTHVQCLMEVPFTLDTDLTEHVIILDPNILKWDFLGRVSSRTVCT